MIIYSRTFKLILALLLFVFLGLMVRINASAQGTTGACCTAGSAAMCSGCGYYTCQVYNQSTCPGGYEWHVNQTNPTCLNSPSCTGGGVTPGPTSAPQPTAPAECNQECAPNYINCNAVGLSCDDTLHCSVGAAYRGQCSAAGDECRDSDGGIGRCYKVCSGNACGGSQGNPTSIPTPLPHTTVGGSAYCAENNQSIPNALINVVGDGRPDYQTDAIGIWLTGLNYDVNYISVRFREGSVPYSNYIAPNCAISSTCDSGGTPSGPPVPNQIYCDPWSINSYEYCGLLPGSTHTQFNFAFTDCLPCTNPTLTVQVNTGTGFQVVTGALNLRYGDQVRLTPSVVAGTTVMYVNPSGQQVPAISCSSAPGRPSCASSTFTVDSTWGTTGTTGRFMTFQYTYSPSVIWNVPRASCNTHLRNVNIVNRTTAMGFTDNPAECVGSTSGLHEIGSFTNSALNNPFELTATYTDLDGIADIDEVGIWVHNATLPNGTPTSGPPYNPGSAIGAGVRRLGTNSYQLFSFQPPSNPINISITNNDKGVCLSGTTQTAGCTIVPSAQPANALAYAYPRSITEIGNSIQVVWSIGMFSSAVFNGPQNIHIYSKDIAGSTGNWGLPGNGNGDWNADLIPPAVNTQVNPLVPLKFSVAFTASDNGRQLIDTRFTKTCYTPDTAGAFRLSQDTSYYDFSGGAQLVDVCFNTFPGSYTYNVSTSPGARLTFSYQAIDQACNVAADTDGYVEQPSWFLTAGGDAYAQTFVQNLALGSRITINNVFNYKTPREALPETGMPAFVSTYNLMHKNAAILTSSSVHKFFVPSYSDANATPRVLNKTWQQFIEDLLAKNNVPTIMNQTDLTLNAGALTSTVMNLPPRSGPNAMIINGNLTLDGTFGNPITCNTKTVFIVKGNLDITPNFINDSGQNGCIFVVQNNTTIKPGGIIVIPNPSNTLYERIDAFIITDTFTTELNTNLAGLEIVGGVITNTASLLRSNGSTKNAYAPAEIFRYDPRYIYIFDGILTLQQSSSIREKQFINSLESPANNATNK